MGDCACDVSVVQLDPTAPLASVYLELTSVCHNACPGCSNVFAHSDTRQALSAVEWGRIFEGLAAYSPRLRFTGGEPTLHPEFEQIVRQAQGMGLAFSVFTNARWLEPARTAHFLAGLPGLECILVSLHGARAYSHEAFTATPESFDETIANIRRAADAGIRVSTSTVVTQYNHREIPDIITLSRDLGTSQAVFNRYIGTSLAQLEANPGELTQAIQAVEQASHNGSRGFVKWGTPIPHCFEPNSSNGCMAGFAHVTIDPWGNVRPCPHVPLVAGNVLNGKSMDAILHGPVMMAWRSEYLAQCEECGHEQGCFAGCLAMGMARGGRDPLLC